MKRKKTEPEETTHNQRAHILVLALTSINAYISEEHQLHFSFMSPLFLPHWFVRPPLGLSLALAHQTFALMMPLLSSSSSFLMPHIYVAAIVLTLTRSHISLSSVCVYDVVDDYKEEKNEINGKKIIKRHKSRAATAATRTLVFTMKSTSTKQQQKMRMKKSCVQKKNCQRQMYENTERQQITNQKV